MAPRRSPGDGTIFKRKSDGLWVGGIELQTADGKRRQKRVAAKTRNEVVAKLRELRKQIDAGLAIGTASVNLDKYMETWLTDVHWRRAKPSTYPGDERTVRNYIIPFIGKIRLDRLTPQHIRDMIKALQETSSDTRKASTRSAQKAYRILHGALEQAVKDGLIARNPAAAVDEPKHVANRPPAFDNTTAIHIMNTADQISSEMWSARWKTGFMTGLREAEVLGLEWDRVDLGADAIVASWQLQEFKKVHGCGDPVDGVYPCGKVRVSFCPQAHWKLPPGLVYRECERSLLWTKPKSKKSDRDIPIIPPLHAALEQLKANDTGPNPHNLVFHHPDGSPFTPSQDQKAWRGLLIAAEVPHKGQHSLRRTAATLLRGAQVDEQTRMDLFGHASADVQRLYAGPEWQRQKEAMGKLADMLTPQDLDEPDE